MEELRLQLFFWLLNYWRVFRPEHFDMSDMWREICESIPDIPECALEGCDTLLFGYSWKAIYCSDYCRKQTPEFKAWQKEHDKIRNSTPERKASHREYCNRYDQSPKGKAKAKEYWQSPEYKAKRDARRQTPEYKAVAKAYRARKKAERLAAEE